MPKKRLPPTTQLLVPIESIERRIYLIRGQKVMLDADLARLYEVPTSRLNEAVKRNRERFPGDFMFQLTAKETGILISQIAMSSLGHGGRRTTPYVFTEHGVAMLSSVLNSQRAVRLNILIIRAFVKLRELLATHKDLARKIEALERQQQEHGQELGAIYTMVKRLGTVPSTPKRRIGFPLKPFASEPEKRQQARRTTLPAAGKRTGVAPSAHA